MSWILAIAVSPARTWAARAPLTPGPAQPELIRLSPAPAPEQPDEEDGQADAPGSTLGEPGSIRTEGMPSAVWSDGTQILVGVEALDRAGIAPHGLVLDPYALLTSPRHPQRDPVELISALLGTAYRLAVADTGSAPARTLVTHPDGWTIDEVLALRQAASRAGIAIDPVPEPIAVAAAYRAFGGKGSRLLMLDADRNTASAIARMGSVFVVLGNAGADDGLAASEVLPRLAEEALDQPGVRRELLDDVLLTGEALEPGLSDIGTKLNRRPATELPSWVLAPGALHYDRSLHEVPPEPAPEPPPPPPPPPPVKRVNHAAPAPKQRLSLVPLLIVILIVLVLVEVLFFFLL